jgi:hypothetical protein
MPPEIFSRAADNVKSRLLPQYGLKARLTREVEACFDYFDETRRGGPISELHANGLILTKLEKKKGYRVEIEVFRAPGCKDSLEIHGRKVTMQRISSMGASARRFLPKEEVDKIIGRIQNVTVPYREIVEARQKRRAKVVNLLTRIRGRPPATGDGGTSRKAER